MDFFDPETVECPFPFYQAARKEAPVMALAAPESGKTMYLVTPYDLVAEVLKDPELYSSRFMNPIGRHETDPDIEAIYDQGWPWVDTLLTSDPPRHKRYRTLVAGAFTGKRVRELAPEIENIADELVDGLIDRAGCDFVTAFARPLPLRVIAGQYGVPSRDLPTFKRWSDSFVARLGGLVSKEEEVACARDVIALQHYLKQKIDERRASPTDDLISDLVHAQTDDEAPLSDAELINMLQQILVAGNETTANTLAGGLMSLIQAPEQMAAVRADPGLLPGLVKESLRTVTAQSGMWRITTRDTELAGVPIPAGATIMLRYDAANRDPAHFQDPETFNIHRSDPSIHLAFGLGTHFCVGAVLAQKEMEIGFRVLLSRLRNIRFGADNDFRHRPNMLLRGLERLNIEYDKAEPGV
jgi:cytochrome P450